MLVNKTVEIWMGFNLSRYTMKSRNRSAAASQPSPREMPHDDDVSEINIHHKINFKTTGEKKKKSPLLFSRWSLWRGHMDSLCWGSQEPQGLEGHGNLWRAGSSQPPVETSWLYNPWCGWEQSAHSLSISWSIFLATGKWCNKIYTCSMNMLVGKCPCSSSGQVLDYETPEVFSVCGLAQPGLGCGSETEAMSGTRTY